MTSASHLHGEALERAIGYQGKPFPGTHPDRLATLGRLYGLRTAAPERCRVLELGCGDGANLLPMAAELPDAEFVGIELNGARVAAGAAWARELGLRNVQLEARDLTQVGDEYGTFDYVIAHGVYSWVTAPVRDHVLRLCRQRLNPEGVAFMSFNSLPGWHFFAYLRDLAQLVRKQSAAVSGNELLKRVRALANLFAAEQPAGDVQGAHLQQLLRRLETTSDYLIVFDYLSEQCHPVTLTDFDTHAKANGLRYVCDAHYFEQSWRSLTPRSRSAVAQATNEALTREAFADVFTARPFRRALLCHDEAPELALQPAAIQDFQILGALQRDPVAPEALFDSRAVSFTTTRGGSLSTSAPAVKVALDAVSQRWPSSISFAELVEVTGQRLSLATTEKVAEALQSALLELYAAGAVDFRITPPRCAQTPGERPLAASLARAQATRGEMVTNQHHDFTRLRDELSRQLFTRLDGCRNRSQLVDELLPLAKSGALGASLTNAAGAALSQEVEQRLTAWARHALLLG